MLVNFSQQNSSSFLLTSSKCISLRLSKTWKKMPFLNDSLTESHTSLNTCFSHLDEKNFYVEKIISIKFFRSKKSFHKKISSPIKKFQRSKKQEYRSEIESSIIFSKILLRLVRFKTNWSGRSLSLYCDISWYFISNESKQWSFFSSFTFLIERDPKDIYLFHWNKAASEYISMRK